MNLINKFCTLLDNPSKEFLDAVTENARITNSDPKIHDDYVLCKSDGIYYIFESKDLARAIKEKRTKFDHINLHNQSYGLISVETLVEVKDKEYEVFYHFPIEIVERLIDQNKNP